MVSWTIWRHAKRIALGGLGLGDARRPWRAVELLRALARVITLVGYKIAGIFRSRREAHGGEVLASEARQGRRAADSTDHDKSTIGALRRTHQTLLGGRAFNKTARAGAITTAARSSDGNARGGKSRVFMRRPSPSNIDTITAPSRLRANGALTTIDSDQRLAVVLGADRMPVFRCRFIVWMITVSRRDDERGPGSQIAADESSSARSIGQRLQSPGEKERALTASAVRSASALSQVMAITSRDRSERRVNPTV